MTFNWRNNMKYDVAIEELLTRVIEVEADSIAEAFMVASELYYNEEVVLDSSDFADVNIEVIGETE